MRILIDLQACQSSGSRTRGIGRYSFSLAHAMVQNAQQHDVHLLLNSAFPESVIDLQKSFGALLPPDKIHVWHGVGPAAELEVQNQWRVRASELIREQAIAEFQPDIVHVTSLFEGLIDDAVTSLGANGQVLPTAVTLYDLIPLINANPYLENAQVRAWYYRKVQAIKRAELLLAISESSRQEGLNWLHLPADRIVNISSAVDDRFGLQSYPGEALQALKQRYGLGRPYIMYTGGIDVRKNIEGLIQAFAALPLNLRQQYQLAIVCSAQQNDKERLQKLAISCGLAGDELVMTGFVPDEDLPKLYHACELFVFPSWHEGFGLPALEAMACGAPVIAANTSSLPEVVGRADALFDPRNQAEMTAKILQCLSDPDFRRSLSEHGIQQAKKFSWDASGKTAISAFEAWHDNRKDDKRKDDNHNAAIACSAVSASAHSAKHKPRLAYFSPLPPEASGIADYSAELLPELAVHYDIELIVDQKTVSDSWLAANFPVRDRAWFEKHVERFDRIVYNIGNSTFHTMMLELLPLYPGVVVLHDFYLSGVVAHLDLSGQKTGLWDMALYSSHGYTAYLEKQQAQDQNQIIWKYPCNQIVLQHATGVVVHSQYAKKLAADWYGEQASSDWQLVPFLCDLPQNKDRQAARKSLGLAEQDFLICSFGILGPTKLNQVLLDAWLASNLASNSHCHLVFVGKNDGGEYGLQLLTTIRKSIAADRIKITGFADDSLFKTYLQAADAAVQLRGLSRGETSGAVFDCMAYGVPVIVNSNGAMAELPEHALIKMREDFAPEILTAKMEILFSDSAERARLGDAGIAHLQQHHAPQLIGQAYATAIENFYARNAASSLRMTIDRIAELDMPATGQDLMSAAQCLNLNRRLPGKNRVLFNCTDLSSLVSIRQQGSLIESFLRHAPVTWRTDPVHMSASQCHLAVADFDAIFDVKAHPAMQLADDVLDFRTGDVLVCPVIDAQGSLLSAEWTMRLQVLGVRVIHLPVGNRDDIKEAAGQTEIKTCWRTILEESFSKD